MISEQSIENELDQELDCVVEEFESSIQIVIQKSQYQRIKSKYINSGQMTLVAHYPDGCRIANHKCQQKIVLHKTNVLKIQQKNLINNLP
jgi:hypothetical protein